MFTFQSLIWLLLGGITHLFSFGRWTLSVADWLVPFVPDSFTRGIETLAGALAIGTREYGVEGKRTQAD
ncbi:MAG: hypothetical protein PVG14_14275 [Anaerolineales bacterium]|jgi:hypothetical protein